MCGLLGILCATPEQARQLLAPASNALQIQRHRGPDETDIQVFDEAVLGLNRLALVDVDHAHQPLLWGPPEAPRRYALLFNGEIYNHRELRDELTATHGAAFATLGDGEAIAAAYHHHGAESVSRLRGMFAFVIWDTRDKVLFGARDPFGIKPLEGPLRSMASK